MKTDSESQSQETMEVRPERASSPEDEVREELRPRLNAIVEIAELIKMKTGSDENVQRLLTAAHGLLDVINRKSAKAGDGAPRSESNQQYDVLYIEDDSINFATVKLLLKTSRALKVLQATTGKSGIASAHSYNPRLILLDLDLPDMHGSDVFQQLQKDPATARIPVVVMSGDATPSQIERLLVLGARNYLTKPFQVEPFLAVVDDVMQESAAVPAI